MCTFTGGERRVTERFRDRTNGMKSLKRKTCTRLACRTYRAVHLSCTLQKVIGDFHILFVNCFLIVVNFDEVDLLLLIYYFKLFMKTRCEKMTMVKGNNSNSNLEIADCSSIYALKK